MTTWNVTTQNQLNAAIAGAVGGDRIEIHSGIDYTLTISGKSYSSEVIFTSYSTIDKARIVGTNNTNYITSSDHITLDHLIFINNATSLDNSGRAIDVTGGTYLKIQYCIFAGQNYPTIPTSYVDLLHCGRGIYITDASHCDVLNNEFRNLGGGAGFFGLTNFNLLDNEFHWLRYTGFYVGRWNTAVARWNMFRDFFPYGPAQGGTDHPDWITMFEYNYDTDSDVYIEGNAFVTPGSYLLIQDNSHVTEGCFSNINVRYNFLWCEASQQEISGFNHGTIDNNTVLVPVGYTVNQFGKLTYIRPSPGGSTGSYVSMQNNVAGVVSGATGPYDIIAGNVLIGNYDIFAQEYIGSNFVCGIGFEGMNFEECAPIPGSYLQQTGKGCWEYWAANGKIPKVYIAATFHHGTPTSLTVDFSLGDYTGGDGIPGGSPTVSWSFGDGYVGSGSNVSHTYTAGGTYLATMTVVDAGITYTMRRAFYLWSPLRSDLKFDGNLNQTSLVTAPSPTGTSVYVDGVDGQAIDLTSHGRILWSNASVLGPSLDVTYSFDLKLISPGGTNGRIMYTGGLEVIKDTNQLATVMSSKHGIMGERLYVGIDGQWRHVQAMYQFSTHTLTIEIDGAVAGTKVVTGGQYGLAGGPDFQVPYYNEWVDYYLDNFRIWGALVPTADEAALHASLGPVVATPRLRRTRLGM